MIGNDLLTTSAEGRVRDACKKKIAHFLSSQDNHQISAPTLAPKIVFKTPKMSDFFYISIFLKNITFDTEYQTTSLLAHIYPHQLIPQLEINAFFLKNKMYFFNKNYYIQIK